MESAEDKMPKVPQQDHETKSEALVNPTKVKVKKSKPKGSKLSKSDFGHQLLKMQMASWQIVGEIDNNITRMENNHALHQSYLHKTFRDCHRLLEIDEETRIIDSKKQEDQVMEALEEKTLQLVHLMEQIKSAQTKDQLSDIEGKLKTLEGPEEDLDIGEPPVHLRISQQIMHIVKPVPEKIWFDSQSAHMHLALSLDFKQVRFDPTPKMAATSERFEPGLYVLGTPGFNSGRHYWEVNVGNKSNWIIGVVKESVERKGVWELNSSNGYWVLRKQGDHVYYGIGNTCEMIRYNSSPMRIGVCLDLFKSYLVFYNADIADIIHQLSLPSLKETLRPFFCPGIPMSDDDWCPLTICA